MVNEANKVEDQGENSSQQLLKNMIFNLEVDGKYFNTCPLEELEIAYALVDINYETRLPREEYKPEHITSVVNTSVAPKLNNLRSKRPELADHLIPESLTHLYPLKADGKVTEEGLEISPAVNIVHAWNKVLNEMNTIAHIQRGEFFFDGNLAVVFASIAQDLYDFTVESDGKWLLRSNNSFLEGTTFVETQRRLAGAKGVNSLRHVCYQEMKYILDTIKTVYAKKE